MYMPVMDDTHDIICTVGCTVIGLECVDLARHQIKGRHHMHAELVCGSQTDHTANLLERQVRKLESFVNIGTIHFITFQKVHIACSEIVRLRRCHWLLRAFVRPSWNCSAGRVHINIKSLFAKDTFLLYPLVIGDSKKGVQSVACWTHNSMYNVAHCMGLDTSHRSGSFQH